ncbi:MAG: hypothetical protein JWL60_1434 [Gemmatimonadetes bacterium]|nr:hypothetical protein [Gemmatimonadota bacterium]
MASLGRVFGPGRGVETWARACRAARVSPGAASTPDLLERCSQALASEGGAAATVARSVAIRLRTFNRLVASAAATTPEKSS